MTLPEFPCFFVYALEPEGAVKSRLEEVWWGTQERQHFYKYSQKAKENELQAQGKRWCVPEYFTLNSFYRTCVLCFKMQGNFALCS